MRLIFSALALTLFTDVAAVARSSTITGSINDSAAKPVMNATVLVYSAGVRSGYSLFCPTCYVDCGKRAATDALGRFTIPDLADNLVFNLLAIKQGYEPKWIRHVDPLKGAAGPAVMKSRNPINDPSRVLRGRVVDSQGIAVRDALVEGEGVTTREPSGQVVTSIGSYGGTDMLAVSNDDGEFEIAYATPASKMLVLISPRGRAPKLVNAATGADRKTITVTDGGTVRGRLMEGTKPVPNVEFVLSTIRLDPAAAYPEVRAATDAKGRFAITNVPPRRVWNLYATWESLSGRGAVAPMQCVTESDGQDVDIGDIPLKRGLSLSGRVVLSDGKPIAEGMSMLVTFDRVPQTAVVPLAADGRFELRGLAAGAYTLEPAVRGYEVPEGVFIDVLVKHSVSAYVVRLEPAPAAPVQ